MYEKTNQIMAIHTGLSVTVVGHIISLDRDEKTKRATIVVTLIKGHITTGLEGPAIKVAADLLAQRARRFLGREWTVVEWGALQEIGRGA